ncbi:hypothetical protein VTO42DRAFT_677 [Malbranchea cinnamomea]
MCSTYFLQKMPSPKANAQLPSSTEMNDVCNTMHLLYHRNKNQHLCAKWFKQLSMLRRATRKLAWEIEEVERIADDIHVDADKEHSLRMNALMRMEFLCKEIVPRSYRAFSTVVADTQFSALGVVLIALLSRLAKITGAETFFTEREKEKKDDKKKGQITLEGRTATIDAPMVDEDFGEVIQRDEITTNKSSRIAPVSAGLIRERTKNNKKRPISEKEEDVTMKEVDDDLVPDKKKNLSASSALMTGLVKDKEEKRKKKRRKGNAIDDIFGDL